MLLWLGSTAVHISHVRAIRSSSGSDRLACGCSRRAASVTDHARQLHSWAAHAAEAPPSVGVAVVVGTAETVTEEAARGGGLAMGEGEGLALGGG